KCRMLAHSRSLHIFSRSPRTTIRFDQPVLTDVNGHQSPVISAVFCTPSSGVHDILFQK
ncbi:hypothetical protein BDZ89DRAFT_1069028, partial [Hymenopellis radicata]